MAEKVTKEFEKRRRNLVSADKRRYSADKQMVFWKAAAILKSDDIF